MKNLLKKKGIFTTIYLLFFFISTIYSQDYLKFIPDINKPSQSKQYYNKPGAYELAAVLDKTEVSKGENLKLNLFITGYGIIETPKLSIYPSSTILNSESIIYTSLRKVNDSIMSWGGDSITFDNMIAIQLSGGITLFEKDKGVEYTIFMDAYTDSISNLIFSEISFAKKGPVSINLKVKRNIDPGLYKIKFFLTYFNGDIWKLSQTTVEFRVNNWVEDHPVFVVVLGLIFAFLALFTDIFQNWRISLSNTFKRIAGKNKKKEIPESSNSNNENRKVQNVVPVKKPVKKKK